MKINIVPVDAFTERARKFGRLDAEFVDADLLQIENGLRDLYEGQRLSTFSLTDPAIFPRSDEPSLDSVSYVAIDNIDAADGFLFHQALTEEELPGRAKYKLEAYDILVSNVRPERGAIGIVLPVQAGCVGSSGLTVVRLDPKFDRELMFAYLRTNAARAQLVRRSRGSMYPP